jgi:DNA mismatch repair ATPase MutS
VSPDADRVAARGLGHPLLPDAQRVVNDVEVGPPGSLLLVTGSNMSGKSTLLRSIGVNVVLAQMGAPVCAEDLSMPPLAVYTSMRVQDSLEAGVSYFMAALQRLKFIVEAARRSPHGAPRLMYLLDEILQGTNTAERQVAVRHILGHLLALPVIGAVTTHDLELGSSPELVQACRSVHFTEGVEDGEEGARLSFDYKLRPGVATSRNALKLLRLVGLDT